MINYLEKFSSEEFPIFNIDDDKIIRNYKNLVKNEYKYNSNASVDSIISTHKSIWKCNVNGYLSPFDAWYNKDLLEKCIDNRLKYVRENISEKDIVRGFSVAKIAPKVTVFRPALAKYLISKYLNEFDTIFDPCSGFSGRLLGTCALGKRYLGQDINRTTIGESNYLIRLLKLDAEIASANSIYSKGSFDCLFTCPPYGDKENWHQDIEILTEDEWIDVCLNNFKCKKYLFVVGDTKKYKNNIVEELTNKSHFSCKKEYIVLITGR